MEFDQILCIQSGFRLLHINFHQSDDIRILFQLNSLRMKSWFLIKFCIALKLTVDSINIGMISPVY